MNKYDEILVLKDMLERAEIPFQFRNLYDGFQMQIIDPIKTQALIKPPKKILIFSFIITSRNIITLFNKKLK